MQYHLHLSIFLFYNIFLCHFSFAQSFIRTELPSTFNTPWEITYGQDNYLWLTESGGKVCRVNPTTGSKTIVYTAADYFAGSPLEKFPDCHQPNIGAGTLGLALHPDFLNYTTSFIYFVYSYNSGTITQPVTKFKIVKLTWDAISESVMANVDLVINLPTSYDHLGGRLIAVKQNNANYLYFSIGDHGISEDNSPTCYNPQSQNPNNFTQDVNYKNGKIHRFNMDGSIPFDNPVSNNSMFTRGHRNPQGLAYNPNQQLVYCIEHGDRTDDEINILESGKNYGWKNVRGYHADNNYPNESSFVASYSINPSITNDGLKEALYSWCAIPQPTTGSYLDWCTVAPSDAYFYNYDAIPNWKNSLLVTTLKNGITTDQEVYLFKLNADGLSLAPSTALYPNPQRYFSADQTLNGRLRDITVSSDGKKIFLINNGGASTDKITVYTYIPSDTDAVNKDVSVYPNPTNNKIFLHKSIILHSIKLTDVCGKEILFKEGDAEIIDLSALASGIYFIQIYFSETDFITKKINKQ
jgi:aldose sugar dehydrogenase